AQDDTRLIADVDQHQTLRRRRPPRLLEDALLLELAAADLDERSGDAADHVAKESVGADGERDRRAVARQLDLRNRPHRGADLGVDDGEDGEVMLAAQP